MRNLEPITNETFLTESLREWICEVLQNVASYSSCLQSYCVVYFLCMCIFVKIYEYDVAIPALEVKLNFIFWILPYTILQKLIRSAAPLGGS